MKPGCRFHTSCWILTALLALSVLLPTTAGAAYCARTVKADVVALDQVYFWNRLGAVQPQGMIYALRRDVVPISGTYPGPGNAQLRSDKRPRPLVLRMNVGDCLQIRFFNWLKSSVVDNDQVRTRDASVHVVGLQMVGSIASDGSWVGKNARSLVPPGSMKTYTLYGEHEGTYLLYNGGAVVGGQGDNGTISAGLFGAVNVEPQGSVWYRSQVTADELVWATQKDPYGNPLSTLGGHPKINYNAVYPAGHKFAGQPILKILDSTLGTFHSDLNAIIAGPGPDGLLDPTIYPDVAASPKRNEPFREFTVIFHDEIGAVQAFPDFNNAILKHTLHSVRDAFAINYGTGGIGAEIFANRLGVGPMHECTECLYEEFFLTSWAVGDPAMVVDTPANYPCTIADLRVKDHTTNPCTPTPGPKATKAFYPDDPSNVHHSYLNDHVKFRNLLAGSDDHHIFHLHAHQWLQTPDGDNSAYLDSQAIGQGTSFTYEIAHEGSGNLNKTAGDSIFHCHFYPHFAMGMWAMWRVHDVFEEGTELDANGRPVAQNNPYGQLFVTTRALPDAEIVQGTPIPALVPLPGQAMAPMPQVQVGLLNGDVWIDPAGSGNPGYPFYIPGEIGHRPPQPPLDFYADASGVHDGGLPRHVITGGTFSEEHTRLSFAKHLLSADAKELAQGGERWELEAMNFHANPGLGSYTPEGNYAYFELNGAGPVGGAPYADPCYGGPATPPPQRDITYKAANIQLDVYLNKLGWHFPQQRMISLWEDVDGFVNQGNPPQPFFIRANSYDCVTYLHTNLVPNFYELDDFQVRTPTDVLGQHIHLVKFDVTSSDGSANGWNYEDGTLSPMEVVERIDAINLLGGIRTGTTRKLLAPKPHPFFGQFGNPDWLGAQTTVQRWYVDPVLNMTNKDRTLRTVFTHDHFGPSTHQQTGLYAGLVVEPAGSQWFHNETGAPLGGRLDGGPTSWQAIIEGPSVEETYREFLFEFGDFQHAYRQPDGSQGVPAPGLGLANPELAVNPPGGEEYWDRLMIDKPWVYEKPFLVGHCKAGGVAPPCPEAISAQDPGTFVVNYRNEPTVARIYDPLYGTQAANTPGDLSHVFRSDVNRADNRLDTQPAFYNSPLTSDVQPGDPFTPLLRAYENDRVQVRVLVGAHEEEHNVQVHGVRWLYEPSEPDSGFRASQMMGISQHFEFEIPNLAKNSIASRGFVDFLYEMGAAVDSRWNGTWGLLRAYQAQRPDLVPLSTNPPGSSPPYGDPALFNGVCPRTAPVRSFEIAAVAAWEVLPGGTLTYNSRNTPLKKCDPLGGGTSFTCTSSGFSGPLHDPTAMLFVYKSDLVAVGTLPGGRTLWNLSSAAPIEPLVMRAASGDCIEVTLYNYLPSTPYDLPGYSLMPNIIDRFNVNQVVPSMEVGLHSQLVSYDVTRSDAMNVGFNPVQTVQPNQFRTYQWYAGQVLYDYATNSFTTADTEFGAVNLMSSDPIKHSNKGLVGALVIEPKGSTWVEDPGSRTSATVNPGLYGSSPFRDFVLVWQTDPNLRYAPTYPSDPGQPVRVTAVSTNPAETGQSAANYRTEPVWFRKGYLPETLPQVTRQFNLADAFTNSVTLGLDPETPIFTATPFQPARFRVLQPGGHAQSSVFGLHGHIWQEEPYANGSTVLTLTNPVSEWKGSQHGHGPTNHFDVLLQHGAGGAFGVTGDYMWRDYTPWRLADGIWGIFRVEP